MSCKRLEIVAHRGLANEFPENTVMAFQNAAKLDIYGIEFDVHLTADKVLVVTHDDTVERCSDGVGKVGELSFAELRKMDFGAWKSKRFAGVRIPTLEESIDAIISVKPSMNMLVEIKEDDLECAAGTLSLLLKRKLLGQCMMTSFSHGVLKFLRKSCASVKLHASECSASPSGAALLADSVGVCLDVLTPERTALYKNAGKRVDAWVVDTPEQLRKALLCGVNGITSNCANEIAKLNQ